MRTVLSLAFSFLLMGNVYSNTPSSSIHIDSKKIETLIQKHLPNTKIGIILQDPKTGQILYNRHIDEAFTPASCTKLLTAAAGLLYLGPNYRYETSVKVKSDGLISGVQNGDIYFQFSGDPSFTTEDLKALIKEVRNSGILAISGDIIIDNTRFQGLNYGLGWIWNSLWWYYSAPITTVMLNQNAVKVELSPTQTVGEKVVVKLDPKEASRIILRQNLVSVTEEEAAKHCLIMIDTNTQNEIDVQGCWPIKEKVDTLKIALKNPDYYLKKVIFELLKEEGIRVLGDIKYGVSVQDLKDLKTLAVHHSAPFNELLKSILQDSNNIYSESVTKTLGFMRFQKGTFQAGVRAIQEILSEQLKLDTENMRLMDGSGLSRYNLVTPRQFSNLLYGMYKNETFKQIFRDSLAVTGESGTLKERGEQNQTEEPSGKVYAKTGSLMGVSSLSGYIVTKKGKELIFSIMIDDALKDNKVIKEFEDELCRIFLNE